MSLPEKLDVLARVWASLRDEEQNLAAPAWHENAGGTQRASRCGQSEVCAVVGSEGANSPEHACKLRSSGKPSETWDDGHAFCARQQAGRGDYFLGSLEADIDPLARHAGIHRVVFGSHRLFAPIFPYAVYYEVVAEKIWVWAVVDCRRSPSWIARRLNKGRRSEVGCP